MYELTEHGRRWTEELAERHGVSHSAVLTLLRPLIDGGGTMAQFNHPDLGGMGQWVQGGMTMVGNLFDDALKAKVNSLCVALAKGLRERAVLIRSPAPLGKATAERDVSWRDVAAPPGHAWWPVELGTPAAVGVQNDVRYGYFPAERRLAISRGSLVRLYDTGDHIITGFGQQQGAEAALNFTSQHGLVRLSDLQEIPLPGPAVASAADAEDLPSENNSATKGQVASARDDILNTLEQLGRLRQQGILSAEEFAAKKAELLARL